MPEALVTGRVALDLYPEQVERPLEDVETFRRYAGSIRHQPGRPVPVVNGLGAGDAFAAGWGYALLRGADPAPIANAAGAIVASRHSCSAAMPAPSELEALLGAPVATAGGNA